MRHLVRSSLVATSLVIAHGCAETSPVAPSPKLVTVPKPVSSAPPPLVVTPSKPASTGDFVFVLATRDKHPLGVYAAGDRALVTAGNGIWGFATKGKKPAADATVGAGLPTSGASHVQQLGGRWPDIAIAYGGKDFIHYAGPEPQLFASRGGRFVLEGVALDEVPGGVGRIGEDVVAFVPSPSHYQDGAQAVLERPSCKAKAKRDAIVTVARGAAKRPIPKVPATFFMQDIAEDGEGRPWAVGADVCAPGAYLGMLGDATVAIERVPGSDGCRTIDEAEGVVMTHASVFPAASGLYALLVNKPPSLGENVPTSGPCTEAPKLLRREKNRRVVRSARAPRRRGVAPVRRHGGHVLGNHGEEHGVPRVRVGRNEGARRRPELPRAARREARRRHHGAHPVAHRPVPGPTDDRRELPRRREGTLHRRALSPRENVHPTREPRRRAGGAWQARGTC